MRAAVLLLMVCAGTAVASSIDTPNAEDVSTRLVPVFSDYSGPMPGHQYVEANNILFREQPAGFEGAWSAASVARRWRRFAQDTRGVFALRDSLYSQQDHVLHDKPYSLMLPPSWIHAAVARPHPIPARAFALEDDAAWTSIPTADALFGDFPVSPALFRAATRGPGTAPAERRATIHARRTLGTLAVLSRQLVARAQLDATAAIQFGAAQIALSDRVYFTPELRRRRIIPILVENPTAHELREGKGLLHPDLPITPALYRELVTRICRTRLGDGDIALERYDLSDPRDVNRALTLLEWIIPDQHGAGGAVWLWVTGRLRSGEGLAGENALAHISSFLEQVAGRRMNAARLRLLLKPAVPADSELRHEFQRRGLGPNVYLSVDSR